MVNHTATSDILKFMEQEHREYALLEELGLFSSLAGYLRGDVSFGQLNKALAGVQAKLGGIFQQTGSPLFGSVLSTVAGILELDETDLQARRGDLEGYDAQLRHGFGRVADMLRVNQAIQKDANWHSVFQDAGLELQESGEIRYQGKHHAGGYCIFGKP